ncbi:MAG: hypothetical protein AAGI89_07020 [Pseudomonadota bacterium]
MNQNDVFTSPLELALKKARDPEAGEPLGAPPRPLEAVQDTLRERPRLNIAALPSSDADFDRFESRFGITPGTASPFNSAIRIVRTRLLQALKDVNGQVIGITSPRARSGKTVTAIHIARACARRPEQTVVLADFNLQRPLISGYLGAHEFRSGMGYFRGEGPVERYLTKANHGNLLLFLVDRSTGQSAELLSSARVGDALNTFRSVAKDTVIILNLPSILGSDDVMTILPLLDGVVLVTAAGEATFSEVEEASNLIPKEKLLFSILNKSKGSLLPGSGS